MQRIGRNFYDTKEAIQIPNFKLEIWLGFRPTIRQQEDELMLCIDVDHKILRYARYQISRSFHPF